MRILALIAVLIPFAVGSVNAASPFVILPTMTPQLSFTEAVPAALAEQLVQHLAYREDFDNAHRRTFGGELAAGTSGAWTIGLDGKALSFTNSTDSSALRYFQLKRAKFAGTDWQTDGAAVAATVSASEIQGGAAGLLAGYPDTGSYLVFAIGQSGYLVLEKKDGHASVIAHGQNDAIHPAASNRLAVTQRDGQFHFSINQADVFDLDRPALANAPIGLAAFGKGQFVFDDFEATPAAGILPKFAPSGDAHCGLPPAGDNDRVIGLSVARGGASSTVGIAGPDRATKVVTVDISPGPDKLYLVASAAEPTIWRLRGATRRVGRFAAFGNTSGVSGLDAKTVQFITGASCWSGSFKFEDSGPRLVTLSLALGRLADQFVVAPAPVAIALPTGTVTGADAAIAEGLPPHANAILLRSALRADPGGLVDFDPAAVVAQTPPIHYELMPRDWGLLQLMADGTLTPMADATSSSLPTFRIDRPLPAFPPEMRRATAVRFLLSPGLPMPAGDAGNGTVEVLERWAPLPWPS